MGSFVFLSDRLLMHRFNISCRQSCSRDPPKKKSVGFSAPHCLQAFTPSPKSNQIKFFQASQPGADHPGGR